MEKHDRNETILLLGGTREAAELAMQLTAEGQNVITSLAGRTREPKPVAGKLRIGGFGGPQGLADYLRDNAITRMIDATHPFATQISKNAKAAAHLSGVPLEIVARPKWLQQEGDNWIIAESLEAARDLVPAGARVLLALGSQHIAKFSDRADVFFLVRMVDAPVHPLPLAEYQLVIAKPSSDWQEEKALLVDHAITHIVCRNSGGKGAYSKLVAARELGLPVIMVERPA